jgi:hypothetical protein
MTVFSPKQLRANSKGRFLFKDYQDHCEQRGHPVPRGIFLLGGRELGSAQAMLVDLLVHCWRTWDQVRSWLMKLRTVQEVGFPDAGLEISQRLREWGKRDPIYALRDRQGLDQSFFNPGSRTPQWFGTGVFLQLFQDDGPIDQNSHLRLIGRFHGMLQGRIAFRGCRDSPGG